MRLIWLPLVLASASFAAGPPVYSEDVAPILLQNCASCHRPGQAAPFSLLTFEDAKKRGALIAAVTKTRYMPPWHAEPSDFPFHGNRTLQDDQIATLEKWVAAGMPEGDPAKAPKPPDFVEGWELGRPDAIATMSEPFEVRAEGPDIYQYFALDIPITETRYIRAVEFQPGSRKAVHHALGFLADGKDVASKKPDELGSLAGKSERILTWALGTNPRILPENVGIKVEPGMKLIAQMHYHPSGKVELDQSSIGLYFADQPPSRRSIEVQTPPEFGHVSWINVPAGSDSYTLNESFTLPVDVDAFATFAHAHYIGKAFDLKAHLPSGETKTLLKISNYDFAWQELYNFRDPVRLPKNTRLEATIRWDNRAENPVNPYQPPKDIAWGLFSEEEMGSIILDVVVSKVEEEQILLDALKEHELLSEVSFYLATDGKFCEGRCSPGKRTIERAGKNALERFDKNGDGQLDAAEKAAGREFLRAAGFDDPNKRDSRLSAAAR